MKWKSFYTFISLLLFVLLFGQGCCCMKKINETVTTITKIDTVLTVIRDTVPIIKTVYFGDTAKVENSTAAAISYIDQQTGKIVLQLTGIKFDVPVKLSVIKTVKKEIPVKKEKRFNNFVFCLIAVFIGLLLGLTLFRK